MGLPNWSRGRATNCTVPPAGTVAAAGDTSRPARTSRSHVADLAGGGLPLRVPDGDAERVAGRPGRSATVADDGSSGTEAGGSGARPPAGAETTVQVYVRPAGPPSSVASAVRATESRR